MRIRELEEKDILPIDAFWKKHHKSRYGIPQRKFLLTDYVAVDDNDIPIAYGIIRSFAEALLYVDKDASKFQQAKAFKLLMDAAIVDCKKAELDELNVGVDDPSFAAILEDKYLMRPRDQKILSLEI